MRRRVQRLILLCVVSTVCASLAAAGENRRSRHNDAAEPADEVVADVVDQGGAQAEAQGMDEEKVNGNNGNGIGPGGLPALRDRLEAAIAQNAADIAQNAADIADNAADIAQNASDIADNAGDIADNASDIAANAADIAQNKADIAQNASDIATNAAAIAQNSADIMQLQDDLDTERERIDQLEEDLFVDNDGDGVTELQGDCDDTDDQVSPLVAEVASNGIDDDCDLLIDE